MTVMQHPNTQHPNTGAPARGAKEAGGGDAGGMGRFHTVPSEEREHNVAGRIVGTIVGLAILLGGAFYLYTTSTSTPPPPVRNTELPAPAPVQ